MNCYIINRKTVVITPLNERQSIVYELGKQVIINKAPLSIVRRSCYVFGSSFDGRVAGSKEITGYMYKVPIIVQESDNVIIFPTKSAYSEKTEWIALNHVVEFYQNHENDNTFVRFDNGLLLEMSVSYNVFKNQFLKASCLANKIKQNI
ncbi:MAG: competence protein ComK [Bacilli bacterium]|nr:competence protein ComK [Bacilli bacterium]